MCNYSGRLIAWIDGELPEEEALNVEWHVGQCGDCRRAVRSYREISGAFLDCYVAAMPVRHGARYMRWVGIASGVAAGILLAVMFANSHAEKLVAPVPAVDHAPAIAFQKTPARMLAVHAHHTNRPKPILEHWVASEPTIEVALPADALFPPGAVPAGFTLITDIRP
jgi:anti-sigma factor RsiW